MELAKIPTLLEHYSEHKQQQSQLTFNDFLFMHYVGDDANDQDNSSDEQLPFKNSSENNGLNIIGLWKPDALMKINEVIESTSESVLCAYDENYFHRHQAILFRPPVFV